MCKSKNRGQNDGKQLPRQDDPLPWQSYKNSGELRDVGLESELIVLEIGRRLAAERFIFFGGRMLVRSIHCRENVDTWVFDKLHKIDVLFCVDSGLALLIQVKKKRAKGKKVYRATMPQVHCRIKVGDLPQFLDDQRYLELKQELIDVINLFLRSHANC